MKAVIAELKKQQRVHARALKVVEGLLARAEAAVGKPKRRRKAAKAKKTARKVLGRGIAPPTEKRAAVKKGNGKADELAAKRARAAQLKGGGAERAEAGNA